ncbi:MAG: oprP [Panacagrimonas sp.]|jgi:phosphate-selective porin OprO/OprP|nr:porin [Panacagrimonas sp.]MCC2657671.1 oprP [Panacagrimonas sp.]
MNKLIRYGTLAVFVGSGIGVAHADLSETKGGITIKTEDGRFEAKIGGRIHLDTNIPLDDDEDNIEEGIGEQKFDAFFRRARLSLEGKAYGWSYKFENDFAGQDEDSGSGFREMWIGTRMFDAFNVRFGQAKPYRAMEEMTSSNEILFMERPFISSGSFYGGRPQYILGVFVDNAYTTWGWGLAGYNLRNGEVTTTNAAGDETPNETDGMGGTGRVYFVPVLNDTAVLHLGFSASYENPSQGQAMTPSSARYSGRSGPSASWGDAATDEDVSSLNVELAGKYGPFYAQAEYATAEYAEATGVDTGEDDAKLNSYYIQASWLITGETKPYDIKRGSFKSPKPSAPTGAWELKARYDFIELEDVTPDREAETIAVGVNWYINPAVRLMVEYITGERKDHDGTDPFELDIISTRLQFAF